MPHKEDSLTITFMVRSLHFTHNTEGEYNITWSRHGKSGSTSLRKIGTNNQIKYDVYFPMECNFKRKNNTWLNKIVTIFLNNGKKKLYKWLVNLANLYSKNFINEDLRCNISNIGNVTLSITYFIGSPDKLTSFPEAIRNNDVRKPKRYSISLIPPFQKDGTIPNLVFETRRTSLYNSMRPVSTLFSAMSQNRLQNLNPHDLPPSFKLSNSKFHFTSPQEKSALTDSIDEITKEMREEGPKYVNGVPHLGVEIVDLFVKQPLGTKLDCPFERVCNSICNIAQLSQELLVYGFMSLSYIEAGFKQNNISVESKEINIEDKIEMLFAVLIKRLSMLYIPDLLSEDIAGPDKRLESFFNEIERSNFSEFLIGLIEFALFGSLPAKIAKDRILDTGLDKFSFFDQELLQIPDSNKYLVDTEYLFKITFDALNEIPLPASF